MATASLPHPRIWTIGETPVPPTKIPTATGWVQRPLARIIGEIPRRRTKTNMATRLARHLQAQITGGIPRRLTKTSMATRWGPQRYGAGKEQKTQVTPFKKTESITCVWHGWDLVLSWAFSDY